MYVITMLKIIGHRGAAGLALENSPESIQAALSLSIDAIEFDVRATKDGQLVILHDAHTGRVANKKIYTKNVTLAELQALTLHNGQHILSLEEICRLIGDKKPIILDLKDGGIADELMRVLAAYPDVRPTFSSRRYGLLQKLHTLLPDIPILVQSHLRATEAIAIARGIHATGISINKWLITPVVYHVAKRANLDVQLYTVNHPLIVRFIAKFYPDVSIYTDHPERFVNKSA
jgi:glycerophosphoryl diester phosphodiesterase